MKSIDYSLFDYDVADYGSKYHVEYAPVKSCAHPFGLFHETKADNAVLLLHGFTGYPGELIRPGVDLYEAGFDVLAIRYPGHGTSGDDFLETNDSMWVAAAEDAYNDLCKSYSEVYLVGHSMGGANAVLLAERHSIARIALIAPALVMKNRPWRAYVLRPFASRVKAAWKQDLRYKPYYKNSPCDDIPMAQQYWMYLYPKEICCLLHLAKQARNGISKLNSDALVLFGDNDLSVNQTRSAEIIGRGNCGRTESVVIPGGSHLLPYDCDEQAQDKTISEIVRHFTKA